MVNVIAMLVDAGLYEQFCGTWVRGVAPDVVAAGFGAEASSRSMRTMAEVNDDRWQLPPDRPVLLVGVAGPMWTLVVEPQSYLGADLTRLGPAVRRGTAGVQRQLDGQPRR